MKNGLVERSTRVNQMLDDRSNISRGTLCFAYESKNDGGLPELSRTMAYTTRNTVKTLLHAPETYARSDGCKKHKNFSRQAYSFLEVKLHHLRRKTYEDKYNTRDKNLPVLTCSNHSRAQCRDISVHSKHHILSLKSTCLET